MPPKPLINPSLRAFCAPFVLFLLMLPLVDLCVGQGISNSQYWVFPLQTLVCGALVIAFWKHYGLAIPRGLFFTVGAALLVFGIWISPEALFGMPPRLEGFDPTGSPFYWGTLVFRFLRLVIVVPFLEEIFWRGFLLRYLIKEDFESVPFGTFTWRSFGLVTVFFMLEHQAADYPAAFVTGILYNGIAIRTRSLSSCILAHAITNLLLGFYIMRTGQWGFW
ncbi:MAG: CAAX prenyl protease-related protein [Verrucomicrobiota bacterium]